MSSQYSEICTFNYEQEILNSKSRNKKSLRFKSRTTEQRDEISWSFKSRPEADQL